MFNFKLFLLETQQRIDGIKKAHIPSIAKMFSNPKSNPNPDAMHNIYTHDNVINSVYSSKFADNYEHANNNNLIDHENVNNKINQMEDLKKKSAEQTADTLINTAARNDPDQLKHKHTEWMVNQWKKGHIRAEDFGGRVHDTLSHFMEHGHKLPNKDINSYKHIADLDAALKPHIQVEEKGGAVSDMLDKHPGAKLIHNEPGLRVHEIHTKDASKAIRTADPECKWCTTRHEDNQNYHDNYTSADRYTPPTNKLFVVHATDDAGETHMMQFHFGSNQFNTKDNVNHGVDSVLQKFPKLRNVSAFHDMGERYAKKFIPQHKLDAWSKSSNIDERRKAAAVNGPHIQNLTHDDDILIRNRISTFPGEHLKHLAKDETLSVRHNVAKHPGEHLNLMTNDPDKNIRMEIAKHPGEHLPLMYKDPDAQVRMNIALHGLKQAQHLVNDEAPQVRRIVAQYEGPHNKQYATDPDPLVRFNTAQHPGEHLHSMVNDSDVEVRRQISRLPGSHAEKMINDPDSYVRKNLVLYNPKNKKIVNAMTKDKDPKVKLELAKFPGEHLNAFVKDKNLSVRIAAARMPGKHLMISAKDENKEVRRIAATHEGPHLKISAKDPDYHVRSMAVDSGGPHIKTLLKDKNPGIRWVIASKAANGYHAFKEHLPALAKDPDDDIRHYVAGAKGSNADHLKILTKDKHPEIRKKAKRTLEQHYPWEV